LVVLPAGSDLGSVTVRIELPDGKILDLSDWDFSKGPREIPVTIEGAETTITVDVKLETLPPDTEDLRLVDPDLTKWLLNARWEKDGSYSTAVAAPFTPEAAERGELPSRLLVKLEGLSNVGLSVVWVEGREGKMLCIGGTAKDWEALTESLSVSRIEFGYGDGGVTYRQTFDPPVTFESIPEENRYLSLEPPEPVVVEKGGGCDAGFDAEVTILALLAACLAARKSGRRTV
ncbi:MAG: hypothetical protein LBO82_01575, partial [Synergistaceae bacterium]|nr:hypothetical protein [Synergistaceae bacterium]